MGLLQWIKQVSDRHASVLSAALRWFGGGLMLLSLGVGFHSWTATRLLLKVTGTVTDNSASFAPGGGVRYTPRVRFRAANGDLEQVLTGQGSEDPEFTPGESVPVLYARNDPRNAVIATRWRMYKLAICLAIAGVILFDLGLLLRYGRSWLQART